MSNARPAHSRAVTLVELMISLVVLSIVSVAITFLLQGAARTNSIVSTSIDSQWQVEMAFRRMIQQVRLCTSLTVPSGTTPGAAFTLTTEPDKNNGNQTYTVTYSLITAADGTLQLQEASSNPNCGTSVLVKNIQVFNCRLVNAGTPTLLLLNITAGAATPCVRTVTVATRNF